MLTLGIDPDTCDTAFAFWDENGPVFAAVAHVIRGRAKGNHILASTAWHIQHTGLGFDGVERIAVEGQQIDKRRTGKGDLFQLAQVTGIAISHAVGRYPAAILLVPTPAEWKKGVAKHAHQGRLYQELGWGYEICGKKTAKSDNRYARPLEVPSDFSHISPGQWKHVGDALLLARWAQTQ